MMKKFTFKRQLLFVMLMLLGCLSIQAADDGLITNQVVINLDVPGTLSQKISASDKYQITNLKVKEISMVQTWDFSVKWQASL